MLRFLRVLQFSLLIAPGLVQAARPNVVILFTDNQGTLDANCYGSTDLITPNIDKLAATGVRFTQAYAHTVCCPARAALLTGRHPQRGGVYHWTQGDMNAAEGINMALEEVTLVEMLRRKVEREFQRNSITKPGIAVGYAGKPGIRLLPTLKELRKSMRTKALPQSLQD